MIPEKNHYVRYVRVLAIVCLWCLILLSNPWLCASHGHDHNHNHAHDHNPAHYKYSKEANEHVEAKVPILEPKRVADWSIWTDAIISTLLISAAPFLLLFLVPLDKSKEKEPLLKTLLAFASGGLLGDAFLHLIPHALEPHGHDGHGHSHGAGEHDHSHDMSVGISVLLGIIAFLLVEKFVRLIKGGHGHSHGKEPPAPATKKGNEKKDVKKPWEGDISVSAYLNLAADFTHNLTDGLAIGASFLVGRQVGIITTITILLHEVPHEIGDIAILVQSGCSKSKAMKFQLVTALGALLGTVIALLADGIGDVATSVILPFTAGGFIYISTVSIIPELLEDTKFVQSLKEIAALLLGVLLMVAIAAYE